MYLSLTISETGIPRNRPSGTGNGTKRKEPLKIKGSVR